MASELVWTLLRREKSPPGLEPWSLYRLRHHGSPFTVSINVLSHDFDVTGIGCKFGTRAESLRSLLQTICCPWNGKMLASVLAATGWVVTQQGAARPVTGQATHSHTPKCSCTLTQLFFSPLSKGSTEFGTGCHVMQRQWHTTSHMLNG